MQAWVVVTKSYTKLRLRLGSGGAEVELRYAPAQLDVSMGGQPVLQWNAGKQFVFEHTRQKQVGVWAWRHCCRGSTAAAAALPMRAPRRSPRARRTCRHLRRP